MNFATAVIDPVVQPDDLDEAVKKQRSEINALYYTMSVGEVVSLYENDEIVIDPAFQRLFRWTDEQKTRLVESILLGIPLPPIFVGAQEDGTWEVIDGMQRLSTILQFMGKLRHPDKRSFICPPLVLVGGANYLPMLEGMKWEAMPKPLRLDFRRARLDVAIIKRGGGTQAKYDLFDRLNSGGTPLSDQELRNCHLINENPEFHEWLKRISSLEAFRACVTLSKRSELEPFHMELACRLLIFANLGASDLKGIGNLGVFITDQMLAMARSDGKDAERLDHLENAFQSTFSILSPFGESAFKRYDPNDATRPFKGPFSVSAYEVIACGIAYHILHEGAGRANFPEKTVHEKIKAVWQDEAFQGRGKSKEGKGGANAASRLLVTIPCGRRIFKP